MLYIESCHQSAVSIIMKTCFTLSYFDETAYLRVSIYIIGVLMVNIELMWGGLEMGERRALVSLSNRFVPSHINSIFTLIHQYCIYPAIKFAKKKMLFNLIIKIKR